MGGQILGGAAPQSHLNPVTDPYHTHQTTSGHQKLCIYVVLCVEFNGKISFWISTLKSRKTRNLGCA